MAVALCRTPRVALASLLFVIAGGVARASAAERFVSPLGHDTANDCLSSTSPCRTIQQAVSQAASADTVNAAKGRYVGPVYMYGSPSLTLASRGGWSTDFSARDVTGNKTVVTIGTGAADGRVF